MRARKTSFVPADVHASLLAGQHQSPHRQFDDELRHRSPERGLRNGDDLRDPADPAHAQGVDAQFRQAARRRYRLMIEVARKVGDPRHPAGGVRVGQRDRRVRQGSPPPLMTSRPSVTARPLSSRWSPR